MVKAKKKNLSELSQKKREKQKKKTLNPFEVHINKDKQKVLGRKSKADRGLPGVSRAKAISKRKGTLLQEYKLKNKDNVFVDKRIGEKNSNMTQEEKVMARFAAERVKAHNKKSIYNLNDEEVLTHRGQTLEEIEKFDDPKSDDEYSDEENRSGKLDKSFTGAHFGGGILSKADGAMSRKDLIDQLIAESKKRKAEKQKLREQTMDLTDKLDSEWKDLLPIMSSCKKSPDDPVENTKADDYDITMRELKFEARGNPSERLKSEEEIIKEEKEKLEALEADRIARMKGFTNDSNEQVRHKSADDLDDGFLVEKVEEEMVDEDKEELNGEAQSDTDEEQEDNDNDDDDDDDKDNSENDQEESKKNEDTGKEDKDKDNDNHESLECENIRNDKFSPRQDDCLIEKSASESEAEGESSDEDNLSDLKESESSGEDEAVPVKKNVKFSDNLTQTTKKKKTLKDQPKSILKIGNEVQHNAIKDNRTTQDIREDLLRRKEIMEKARKELPYTYKAPNSFEELQSWLADQQADYQSVIIDRIIKCNHWSLQKENKDKLANLFIYLLQHLNNYAIVNDKEDVIKCFQIFDRICPYLYDLAHGYPENAKMSIQEVIKEKYEEFKKNKKKYPGLDTLIFFKLVSLLFPTSDFRHPVVTPCLVFLAQILLRSRVRNRTDIAKGLFICTLILEYTTLSKRFAPSAINFLRGVLYTSTPKLLIKGIKAIPPFKTIGELSNLLLVDEDQSNLEIDLTVPLMKLDDLVEEEFNDEFKLRAVITAANLLNEFRNHLKELETVYTIFEPIVKILKPNSFERYPQNVREQLQDVLKEMESLRDKKLEYMIREKKKPKAMRMYEPRIEKVYDGKKHKPMSKERAEREKLLHKYKREKKGALREIRRDRSFLAKVQIKEQMKSDAERKRKVQEIFGAAAVQQNELKKLKKMK